VIFCVWILGEWIFNLFQNVKLNLAEAFARNLGG